MTVNLESATVDQALSAVLKLTNLTARREGDLIFVYSPQEFKQLAYRNQEVETRIYRLNYIRANDVMGMVADLLSPDGTMIATPPSREGISEAPSFNSSGGGGSAGGGGGAVAPSTPGGGGGGGSGGGISGPGGTGGNSMAGGDIVIVRDYKANLKAIDEVIIQIDVAPIQVLVEAVIVSVDLEQNQTLGVNFALVDNMAQALGVAGNGADLVANSGFTPAKLLTVPAAATAQAIAAAGRINGGLEPGGLSSNTNGIKFGFVGKNVSGFVNALETLGEVRVLASPRILVLNKQKAEIQLGQRLGYATVTQNFTSTVQQIQFLNTGTLLRIRPFVSSDGMVRMELHPERSSGATPNGIPQTNTAELTTNVMIPDGATLVIGGLMEDERDYGQQGLPGLNRLPILGAAFGQKFKNIGKRELVVLLTPHVWRPNLPPGPPPHGGLAPPADLGPVAAPASTPAGAPKPAGDATRHVVRAGEDLWSIAKLRYGSSRQYQAIWDANRDRISSPEAIPAGTELRLPLAASLARSAPPTGAPPGPERAPAAATAEAPASAMRTRTGAPLDAAMQRAGFEVEAPVRHGASASARAAMIDLTAAADGSDDHPIHIVGRFESLRSIARDRLGDSRRAAEILALNRDVLRASDRPVPGQHLRLPRDAAPIRRGQ